MDAPTPRMPDGKPDLSGNWIRVRGEGTFAAPELRGLVRNQAAAAQAPRAACGSELAPDCRVLGDRRERPRRLAAHTVGRRAEEAADGVTTRKTPTRIACRWA